MDKGNEKAPAPAFAPEVLLALGRARLAADPDAVGATGFVIED